MHTESRSNVIAHHVRLAIAHSGTTMRAYAACVAAHYLAHVPLQARDVHWHAGADIYGNERANAQILARMLDGATVRLPVSLEESLVLCLPEPYRGELQRELAQRLGLLAAPLPGRDDARATTTVGELCRETGELLQSLAEPLADGKLDATDAPHCARALKEVRDVQGRLCTLEAQLVTVMASVPQARSNVAAMPRKAG
jgi:hypothetical protein